MGYSLEGSIFIAFKECVFVYTIHYTPHINEKLCVSTIHFTTPGEVIFIIIGLYELCTWAN